MRKKTKFNKIFSVLLAVLMLFSAFPIASFAISEGDTVKVSGTSDWISGFYYNFNGNFGTGKHGQHQRIRANGQVAYCVEPGKSLSSGNKTAREEWDGLTSNQQSLIKAALIYGYNGTPKYGYSADTEEVATQVVIWAIALNAFNNGSEELLLSCAFGGSTNSTNRANGREVYYRIKEQIRVHYTIPSFAGEMVSWGSRITLKYNSSTGRYEGSVYDNNGVLSGYTFNLNGVTFTKSGNTLNISTTKVLKNATVSGERTSNYYCNSLPALAAIYCLGKDQTTVTTINRKDPVNAYFTLETESVGNVKLVKTSEDGKVDNVLMHISGNGIEKDVRTGKDGTITVENLIAGTYTATEKVDDFYVPQTAQTFTISPGKTTTVTFNNRLKRGSLEVMKVAEDGKVEGYTFRISGTAISGEIIDFTLTTGADGKAKKDGITVSKVDTESGIPVQGAVYEIKAAEDIRVNGDLKYRKNQTVDTVTTNANGIAVSKALYLGKYVVQEKSVPKPFVLDKTSHNVELIYHNSELEIFNETLQVSDMPQKAIIKLHKVDSETQKSLANAVYDIYANEDITVNGDLKYLKGTLVDTVTTDADGLAYSKELYLGSYRAVEKTAPYAYVLDTDEHIANLEYQGQEVEIFTQGYTVENAPQKAKIELLKVDKETRQSIEKAVYELYAKSDIILNGDVKYPAGTLIETLTTNKDGKATTKPLYLGEYYLLEKTAPYGYVLNPEKIDVTLTYKGQNVPEYTAYVTAEDLAQKGTIRVTKSGESLITVTKDDDIYTPVYADKGLQGAVFNIVAAEDIYTGDGTLHARNGDVVDTITTGENGVAESKELYLGRYKAVEVKAPHGMVINYSPAFVELTYAGQYETLTFAETSVYNERQKATVELQKVLEQDDLFNIGDNEEILNVRFGLYAAETIIALDGTQIPKDGLLEIATSDETGHIEFNCDIPIGKYYVREYATDEHYILSDSKYPVAFDYAGQSVLAIRISANDGVAVDNEIVRGNILGKKVDDNGEPVANAVLGLFNTETTEFTEETALLVSTTDEEGKFAFEDVAYGDYVVREIAAPEGYVLSTVSTPVTISEQAQTVEITVLNSIITGSVSVVKVDEEDYTNKLCGAKFEIFVDTNANGVFDEDVDTLFGELTDGNDGTYFLDGLQYNGYFLHETEAPTGFLKDDNYYYFEIRNDGETVTVSNVLFDASDDAENAEASQGEENTENNAPSVFTNRPIKGVLEITKTDAENGSLIPNTGFRIRDLDGNIIAEGYTDENGVVTFTLRYGKYTYEEFEAAPGYILDEQKHEFEIKEDGVVIQVNATNDIIPVEIPKTGRKENADIALLSSLSFLSVALYFSLKKRKRLIGGAE